MDEEEGVAHHHLADLIRDNVQKWIDDLEEEEKPRPGYIRRLRRLDDEFVFDNESRLNCIKIDYLKQHFQRQRHKNKDCLREYANSIAKTKNVSFITYELFKDTWDTFRASFVVELIYKCQNAAFVDENDPVFLGAENLQKKILEVLIDKTVPFSYVKALFHATEEKKNSYLKVVARFMEHELCLGPIHPDTIHPRCEEADHLLGFVHDVWVTSSEFGRAMFVKIGQRTERRRQKVIQNASELQRAGIQFKGVKRPTFDVRFRRGVLEIPVLSIITETEDFLRAFIAFERESYGNAMHVVTDYCVIMDCLIQSPQDVRLLRESGVIERYLNDDEDVVRLFDKVGRRVPSFTLFCYSDLFDEVNEYCVKTWNSWKAKFRRNYFRDDNQLEAVSFMFAIYIILPVTILQTVFTILSYYNGPS